MTNIWHRLLDMPKYDRQWHVDDIADELAEYNEETKLFMKWSELSDISYTYSRSRWSGHDVEFPLSGWLYGVGLIYMYPKYTSRWLFFRRAGKKVDVKKRINEVRNPKKVHKLHQIAEKNSLDKYKFEQVCTEQLKFWPLLP